MQTILCVKCNSAFLIDETSITPEISSIRCPKCDEKILLKIEHFELKITCPECGTGIPESSSVCSNCGYPLPKWSNSLITCPECSKSVPENSTVCPNCGFPISKMSNFSKQQANIAYSNALNCLNDANLDDAKRFILCALVLFPNETEYRELQGRIDQAAENKIKSHPLYDHALHLFEQNDFEFASIVIDDAIKLFDDVEYKELRTEIQRGIEDKKFAEIQCIEASKALEKSDYPKGLQLIRKAIELFPENTVYLEVQKQLLEGIAESKYLESQQLYSAKDFKGAQLLINQCLDLLPDDPKYHAERSKIESAIDKKAIRKNGKIILIAAIIIIPAVILIISTLKQNKETGAWAVADSTKSISAYNKYLALYPTGKFSSMATTRIKLISKFDEIAWNQAQAVNAIPVYITFIKNHPFSGYLQQANDNIQTLNVQKWAGEYYPDQEYSSNENLELEIQRNFQCFLRTNQGKKAVGSAEILGDKLNIYFSTNIEHYITQGTVYVTSSYNNSKPAMILTENDGILLTSLPQSYEEIYRHPHNFFKRKGGYDVSAYQKNQIKEIVQQYYKTYSNKDFEGLTRFFSNSVKRFYSKMNVTKDEIIRLQQEFWNTTDVTQTKSTINEDSFKIKKDRNGDYVVSFNMNYEVERTNSSKPNRFNINTYLLLNQDYKIESISEVILSRSRMSISEQYINSNSSSIGIGQAYGGGIIFYIDNSGKHGLIAAPSDNRNKCGWYCFGTYISGTSTAIGKGQANSSAITNAGCGYLSAAGVCVSLVLNGYSDWYLPSKDELDLMYAKKDIIGGFTGTIYWSSSESSSERAWARGFHDGGLAGLMKSSFYSVRAIRTF